MQQYRQLLNHLVGTRKQYRWHLNSNRLCRLGVDHQFKFRGLLNGQIGWFGPLQYFINVLCGTCRHFIGVWPEGQKAARTRPSTPSPSQREAVSFRKINNPRDVQYRISRRHDVKSVGSSIAQSTQRSFKLARSSHLN